MELRSLVYHDALYHFLVSDERSTKCYYMYTQTGMYLEVSEDRIRNV